MKKDMYVLWGSMAVLLGITAYAIFSDKPAKIVPEAHNDVATTTAIGTSTTPSPDTEKFNTKNWSASYTSDTFKFSLTFPEAWGSYRTKELPNGVQFGVEDQDDVFSVIVYTAKEWSDMSKNKNVTLPSVLKKSETHVFTVSLAKNLSEKVMPLLSTYPSILTTFTLK